MNCLGVNKEGKGVVWAVGGNRGWARDGIACVAYATLQADR